MSVDHPYDTPTGAAGENPSSTSARDEAQQAAGTAADESKHVAGVAKDEAQRVASEAQTQVTHLLNQATTQVEEQSRTQRDRLVDTLQSVGDDLEKMATQTDQGIASNLAREAADRVRGLSSRIDGREPRDLLDEVLATPGASPAPSCSGPCRPASSPVGSPAARRMPRTAPAATARRTAALPRSPSSPRATAPRPARRSPALVSQSPPRSTRTLTPDSPTRPAVAGDTTWADTRTTGGLS